ncbi:MAG: tetratricopeptide repeat protein [Lachnospiraceae bacterium]|nr:tetratricopeptide repeat protein [Lachnospiraceae bacterium]
MFCYNCGCHLSEHDYCTSCGVDVSLYKRIMVLSNLFYNEGLARAGLRDLTGAVTSLRQSLKFNKNNIEARNLLGLVYFEMGETVAALSEWVISKNTRPDKNIADDYINMIQASASRLDAINQTIKKYNQALAYCRQDSRDLAVIQLRKVLSMNPKFIRAHQLLALLYMDSEQWDKAKRELVKCAEMDRNNIQTLTYMREVDRMLAPDETGRVSRRKDREEAVRYQTENEVLIQPKGFKEPRRSGVGTLFNLFLGMVIGVAVMYFLVVPSVRTNVFNQSQQEINKISNEIDAKNSTISDLENQVKVIEQQRVELQNELERYAGTDGTLQSMEQLLNAAIRYLSAMQEAENSNERNQGFSETADMLEQIKADMVLEEAPETFQNLYQLLFKAIGPYMSVVYYEMGNPLYLNGNNEEAIPLLEKAVEYDPDNGDPYYALGRCYDNVGRGEEAIVALEKFIQIYPLRDRAATARTIIQRLKAAQ